MEGVLAEARERVRRYNSYEKDNGFPVTEYSELAAAESTMRALDTLWQSCETWDRLYDEWSSATFDALDVKACQGMTLEIHEKVLAAQRTLGDNPVVQELKNKVTAMLESIPCLYDLKATCLKVHFQLKSIKQRYFVRSAIGS